MAKSYRANIDFDLNCVPYWLDSMKHTLTCNTSNISQGLVVSATGFVDMYSEFQSLGFMMVVNSADAKFDFDALDPDNPAKPLLQHFKAQFDSIPPGVKERQSAGHTINIF